MNRSTASLRRTNAVAMGDHKADLILKNCSLVNVYTKEIQKGISVAIINDRIAYVGNDYAHTVGDATKILDIKGRYICPGFVDPHIHIDQFVLPSRLAEKLLLCGTTAIFSDPIDVVSVGGYQGFKEFVKLTDDLFVRVFHVVPGGIPVDSKFSHGKEITLDEKKKAIKLKNVVGMGEVFSWTKVIKRDPKTMESLALMTSSGCIINGHTAGASEKKLQAYVSSGILSCHEPINYDQVLERLRLGMWIMVREGSIRRDLKEIITKVLSSDTYLNRLMFCSDGLDPYDIVEYGHIDHCIKEAIKLGMHPIDAISMASKNCFDYYNMGDSLGGIAPGKLADILVLDDLKSIKPRHVFVGGKLVVCDGKLNVKIPNRKISPWIKNTVKLDQFSAENFVVKSKNKKASVNTIYMQTEIITKIGSQELTTKEGNILASREKDVWKVAAFDRIYGSKRGIVGFLENFGANIRAFASSWSFHENDLIIIGINESDMAIAANEIINLRGGMVVIDDKGKIISMPLEFGGIMSTKTFEDTHSSFCKINETIRNAGCSHAKPHLIPLFLPFLALPSVRILHKGIIDVKKRSHIKPVK